MSIRHFIAATGALASLAAAPAAWAETAIAFDRAALSDPAAAAALYAEVQTAAERACRKEFDGLSVLGAQVRRRAVERCVVETVDRAVRDVGAAALVAVHEGRSDARPQRLAARE